MLNINNPLEVRNAGIRALSEALGPLGMIRFLQQYEPGYGDYTKEKHAEPDIGWSDFEKFIKAERKE